MSCTPYGRTWLTASSAPAALVLALALAPPAAPCCCCPAPAPAPMPAPAPGGPPPPCSISLSSATQSVVVGSCCRSGPIAMSTDSTCASRSRALATAAGPRLLMTPGVRHMQVMEADTPSHHERHTRRADRQELISSARPTACCLDGGVFGCVLVLLGRGKNRRQRSGVIVKARCTIEQPGTPARLRLRQQLLLRITLRAGSGRSLHGRSSGSSMPGSIQGRGSFAGLLPPHDDYCCRRGFWCQNDCLGLIR